MENPNVKRSRYIARIVPSIPAVLSKLAKLRRELTCAKTYDQIRRIEREAEAIKLLFKEVTGIKNTAEIVILVANRRIAEEMQKVPKAAGGDRKSKFAKLRNLKPGRAATGVQKDKRSRLGKLLELNEKQLEARAKEIQANGKDATPSAILTTIKEEQIKKARRDYEKRIEGGNTTGDLKSLISAGKKFQVIYADPPWKFNVYSGKGKQRSADRHYDTKTIADICKLPVAELAFKDCALFLWCVMPELPGALEVIEAWGFKYKTAAFVWVKQNKSGNGIFTGMGYWTRANAEICLFATRGNPVRMAKNVHQVILSPVGRHSAKPDEAAKRIQRLLLGDYLELYGRKPRKGWWIWGNELPDRSEQFAEAAE
jgi:N6-adenosine-specific RNA methylase IME4